MSVWPGIGSLFGLLSGETRCATKHEMPWRTVRASRCAALGCTAVHGTTTPSHAPLRAQAQAQAQCAPFVGTETHPHASVGTCGHPGRGRGQAPLRALWPH